MSKHGSQGKLRLGGNTFGLFIYEWDEFWFRIFGKGLSLQPLGEEHLHLYSTRHAKIQPLHVFNHCVKVLL